MENDFNIIIFLNSPNFFFTISTISLTKHIKLTDF